MGRIGAIVRRLYAEQLGAELGSSSSTGGRKVPKGFVSRRLSRMREALTKRRTILWAVRIAVVLAVLAVLAETVFQFNKLTSSYTVVLARRADVDRELKRRENLIPNLVYAVSEYASYEQGVFRYVSDAREALKSIRSASPAGGMLEKLLPRLIALAEQYPDLKASGAMQDLIAETSNTEDRISDVKRDFNKAAELYNQYRTMVPGNLFALIFGFDAASYIGLDEDVDVPAINLAITAQPAAAAVGQ